MQRNITFKNSKGQRLVGVLHIPKGSPLDATRGEAGSGPFPAVIVQHGLSSDHSDKLVAAICRKLERKQIIAFRFTYSGHKPSQGGYNDVLISQFVKDVRQGVRFLTNLKQADKNHLGLIGHSMGGFASLVTASKFFNDIKAVVTISCFFDIDGLLRKNQYKKNIIIGKKYFTMWGLKVSAKHFQDKIYHDRKKNIQNIHCPALIVHGANDETVEVKDCHKIYNLLKQPKQLIIIKNGDHNFTKEKPFNQAVDLSVEWMKKYL